MEVICNKKDNRVMYCRTCRHGKEHIPIIWQDGADCRHKSKCSIVDKICQCLKNETDGYPIMGHPINWIINLTQNEMATRKIFSDESGKELSYKIDSSGNLVIEICMVDGTIAGFTFENADAISFIQEMNRLRKIISGK